MALVTLNPTVELLEARLAEHGFSVEKFELKERSYTRFVSPSGRVWLTQDAHVSYPFLNATIDKISRDKSLGYDFAAMHEVIVPQTHQVDAQTSDIELETYLKDSPLVVKPLDASLSRGVSLNVRDLKSLKTGIESALQFSDTVLVQQQIEGDELRFVVVGGKVRAALLRQTARVTGDGTQTMGQLIAAENKARKQLTMPYVSYPQLTQDIIDLQAMDLDEVPAKGEVRELGRGTMIKTGASIYNVLKTVDDSYIDIAEKLTKALGAEFVVVDVMIKDYTVPAMTDNYAFIEFNTAPVLKLFYSCRDDEHFDVLEYLAPMIAQSLEGEGA
jgi:D-alanine-D-alanine ligase-like ATP-grasp enzyme